MTDISQGVQRANITLEAMQEVAKDEQIELRAEIESAQESFVESQRDAVNPKAAELAKSRKPITASNIRKKNEELKDKPPQLLPMKEIGEKAQGFQNRNPMLKQENLVLLGSRIKEDDKAEDILKKVTDAYPDLAMAEEVFLFLLEITQGDLQEQVKEASKQFRELKGPEIEAGKNVAQQAMKATEKELGNYTNLADLYKDITQTPRDTITLFNQLSAKYDYKELKAIFNYILHNLGANTKAKGTNIPHAELQQLIKATRALQHINKVFHFFEKRMNLVEKMFKEQGEPIPEKLSFETLSKVFMNLVSERYPSSEKVKQQTSIMGVENSIPGQIITVSQCRDAVREVALQIYRSVEHRDQVYLSIIDMLEETEESLEEQVETRTMGG